MAKMTTVSCDYGDKSPVVREHVPFAWNGRRYELDLCQKHADVVGTFMGRLVSYARKRNVSRLRTPADRERAAQMRAWIRERHSDCPQRGRIPQRYVDEYRAQHEQAA